MRANVSHLLFSDLFFYYCERHKYCTLSSATFNNQTEWAAELIIKRIILDSSLIVLWPCKELQEVERNAHFPFKSGDNRLGSDSTSWVLLSADSKWPPVKLHQIFELFFQSKWYVTVGVPWDCVHSSDVWVKEKKKECANIMSAFDCTKDD